jgi:hypothetical protein
MFAGTVAEVSLVDAEVIPPQLASRIGGEVATRQDPVTKAERPHQQHYLAAIQLEGIDARAQAGLLGQVRIEAGTATLWWRFQRYLGTTFGWGL